MQQGWDASRWSGARGHAAYRSAVLPVSTQGLSLDRCPPWGPCHPTSRACALEAEGLCDSHSATSQQLSLNHVSCDRGSWLTVIMSHAGEAVTQSLAQGKPWLSHSCYYCWLPLGPKFLPLPYGWWGPVWLYAERPPHFQPKVPGARNEVVSVALCFVVGSYPTQATTCSLHYRCRWASRKLACSTRSCGGSRSYWMQPGSSQVLMPGPLLSRAPASHERCAWGGRLFIFWVMS